jgi:hypothetical protein
MSWNLHRLSGALRVRSGILVAPELGISEAREIEYPDLEPMLR